MAIEWKDRLPTQPNRKKITYEDNSVEYATIEYADEPNAGDEGTPLNKANLELLHTLSLPVVGQYVGLGAGADTVVNLGFKPSVVVVLDGNDNYDRTRMAIATQYVASGDAITITDNGFIVKKNTSFNSTNNHTYIAWRGEE